MADVDKNSYSSGMLMCSDNIMAVEITFAALISSSARHSAMLLMFLNAASRAPGKTDRDHNTT